MKKLVLGLALLVSTHAAFAADAFRLIHVGDLDTLMTAEKSNVHVYDANNEQTRADYGMIPTAEALPSSSHYELATLPADKSAKLVFYCANTECMASHDAAKAAAKAGYKNVYVMADGIEGWKKAGKPVQKYAKKV